MGEHQAECAASEENPADLVEALREECRFLHESRRLDCVEAKAWMREVIAKWIETTEASYSFKELAAEIRKLPTDIGE
jgi:hypothetical protein